MCDSVQACVLLAALLLATSADAARSGRTLLKGGPTVTTGPAPTAPAPTTPTAPAKTPTATTTPAPAAKWNPLVSLAGDKCVLATPGKPILVSAQLS